eukprot:14332551-Alexandrium_andersonii.AAC.1
MQNVAFTPLPAASRGPEEFPALPLRAGYRPRSPYKRPRRARALEELVGVRGSAVPPAPRRSEMELPWAALSSFKQL